MIRKNIQLLIIFFLSIQLITAQGMIGMTGPTGPGGGSCPTPSISGSLQINASGSGDNYTNATAQLWQVQQNAPYALVQTVNIDFDYMMFMSSYCFDMSGLSSGQYVIRFLFDPLYDSLAINSYYGPTIAWTNISVAHWEDAEIVQYNGSDVYLNDTEVLLNYFIACPSCFFVSSGAYIEAELKEGNYSPMLLRGPTDPIVGLDFGVVNSNDEGGVQESDNNGKIRVDNLDSGTFFLIPEVPGIPVDTLLKNISLSLMDSIDLKIIVDSNLVRLDLLTSVKKGVKGPTFQMSPNPTQSMLNLSTPLNVFSIEIHDINGRLVKSKRINNSNYNVDISSYKNGVYFVTIKNGDNWTSKPLIKN